MTRHPLFSRLGLALSTSLALACSDPDADAPADDSGTSAESSTTDMEDAGDATITNGEASTEATSSGATDIDDGSETTHADGPESTTGDDDDDSAGGVPVSCEGITPTTLFTSTEHIGAPANVFTIALLSWWDEVSGDYDESADEFVVPDGSCWCITSVSLAYMYLGTEPEDPELVVSFYEDEGELPGDPWFRETTTSVTAGMYGDSDGRYDIELSEPVAAQPGRTWMSVVQVVEGDERMGWRASSDAADTVSAAHLDLMDCPEFTHYEDCYPGESPMQLAFEIHGAEVPCTGD